MGEIVQRACLKMVKKELMIARREKQSIYILARVRRLGHLGGALWPIDGGRSLSYSTIHTYLLLLAAPRPNCEWLSSGLSGCDPLASGTPCRSLEPCARPVPPVHSCERPVPKAPQPDMKHRFVSMFAAAPPCSSTHGWSPPSVFRSTVSPALCS